MLYHKIFMEDQTVGVSVVKGYTNMELDPMLTQCVPHVEVHNWLTNRS